MSTPLVSVVVPCFNVSDQFLQECAQSLIAQTLKDWEAIFVDDASTSGDPLRVVSSFNDPRFRVLRHSENRGEGAARNTGIQAAQIDRIMPVDADDTLHPDCLDATCQALLDDAEADWVLVDKQEFGAAANVLRWPVPLPPACPAHFNPGAHGLLLRRVWEAVGGYSENPTFRAGGVDYDFWLSAVERGFKVIHVPRVLHRYRIHAEAASSTSLVYYRHRVHETIYRRHRRLFDTFSGDCVQCRKEKRVPTFRSHAYVTSSQAALARRTRSSNSSRCTRIDPASRGSESARATSAGVTSPPCGFRSSPIPASHSGASPARGCHPFDLEARSSMNSMPRGQHSLHYRGLRWIPALAVALLFVGHDPGRLFMAFGPSHDGFNAALYMTGGRAIVEEGPLASQLGASSRTVSGDRVVYAHHPPLVYLEDALALAVIKSPEAAARLPALVSSLTVLVLVVLLLAACGLPPAAAAVGLLVAFATPMFVGYGTMIEPHALGLAPMVALTLLWQRTRLGFEPPSWAFASVAAIATLTSWEAALFAGCVAVFLLLTDRRRAGIAVIAGTAVSGMLIALWISWPDHGELGEFFQRTLHRAGAGESVRVSLLQTIRQQMAYFSDLFPVGGWLMVPVAALGLIDRRTRPLVVLSLGTVLGYAVLFRNGAFDHSYWLYCILLPVALGAAVAADRVSRFLAHYRGPRLVPLLLGTALIFALGMTVWVPSSKQGRHRNAAEIGAQARSLRWPPGQRYAYNAFGDSGPTDLLPWLLFYSRRQPFGVDGPRSVPRGEIMLQMVNGRLVSVPGEQAHDP